MKYFLLFAAALWFTRCHTPNNQPAADGTAVSTPDTNYAAPLSSTQKNTTAPEAKHCYRKITKRDTLLVQLSGGENISGLMFFDNYEKDSSHGLVSGQQQNGLIVVWYNFYSEGMHSVVQHAFKPAGEDLVLGTGALTYRNDSAFIKDLTQVNFRPENLLKRVDCSAVQDQLATAGL